MSEPRNGEIEHHYFDKFQPHYRLPDGYVAHGDKPDVIIHGARKVGIEITNFFLKSGKLPESEQRQRPLRDSIIQAARKLYRADGGKNDTGLTVRFSNSNPISSTRRKKLPQELAELIRNLDDGKSGDIRQYLFKEKMPELSSLWLHSKQESDAAWRVLNLRSPRLMSKNDLEAKVREKEAKASGYEQCDALWLLIVVDGMDVNQDQEIRVDDPHLESAIFDKIIIYEPLFSYIVEVK